MLLALAACASSREPAPAEVELPEAEPSPFESESAIEIVAGSCADGSSREIALDDTLDGTIEGSDFTADDILELVERTHQATIHWMPEDGATVGPESGDHALYVTVLRASDRARDFAPATTAIGHGTRCEHWLELDVTIALQTDDGALNEAIEGTLYASDPRVAYFRASAGDDAFGGALEVAVANENGAKLSRFDLDLVFAEAGVSGTLTGVSIAIVQGSDFESEYPAELAYVGPVHCPAGEFAVRLDDAVPLSIDGSGTSAQQMLEEAELIEAIPLVWLDGARTTATFRFTSDEGGACGAVSSVAPTDDAHLAVGGVASFESADGRVAGSWPAYLEQYGNGGELQVSLNLLKQADAATATPPELGFPGLERGQLTGLDVDFYLYISSEGATGSLRLGGFHCGAGDLETSCDFTSVELEAAAIGAQL